MRKADRTATKVIFIIVFAIFVFGMIQILQFLTGATNLQTTIIFVIGFFVSYFGGMLEEKLYANSK